MAAFDDLLSQYNAAYGQAKAANEKRYGEILGGYEDRFRQGVANLQGLGQNEASDIANRYTQLGAKTQQNLVSRGLSNTTVGSQLQRGLAQDQSREQGALQERLRKQYLDTTSNLYGDQLQFMERRQDQYPDPALLAQLGLQAGAKNAALNNIGGLPGGVGSSLGGGVGGSFSAGGLGRGTGASMGQGPQYISPEMQASMGGGYGGAPSGMGRMGGSGTNSNNWTAPGTPDARTLAASIAGQMGGGNVMGAMGLFGAGDTAGNSYFSIPTLGTPGMGGYQPSTWSDWLSGGNDYGITPAEQGATGDWAGQSGYGDGGRINLNQRPGQPWVYGGDQMWSSDGGVTWGA